MPVMPAGVSSSGMAVWFKSCGAERPRLCFGMNRKMCGRTYSRFCRPPSVVVARSKVVGVFLSSEKTWGTPRTGEWTHLSGIPSKPYVVTLKTADQAHCREAGRVQDARAWPRRLQAEVVQQPARPSWRGGVSLRKGARRGGMASDSANQHRGQKGPRPKQHSSGLPSPRRRQASLTFARPSSRRCWTTL